MAAFGIKFSQEGKAECNMTDEEGIQTPIDDLPDDAPPPAKNNTWVITLVVGLAMLVVGALLGYVGRGQFGPEAQAARATQTVAAAAVQTQAAGNKELMDYLVKQTRHWRGPEDAKVVLIEFSDYQ
jgi:hypothetical protein